MLADFQKKNFCNFWADTEKVEATIIFEYTILCIGTIFNIEACVMAWREKVPLMMINKVNVWESPWCSVMGFWSTFYERVRKRDKISVRSGKPGNRAWVSEQDWTFSIWKTKCCRFRKKREKFEEFQSTYVLLKKHCWSKLFLSVLISTVKRDLAYGGTRLLTRHITRLWIKSIRFIVLFWALAHTETQCSVVYLSFLMKFVDGVMTICCEISVWIF